MIRLPGSRLLRIESEGAGARGLAAKVGAAALSLGVAWQSAELVWAAVTPLDPLGGVAHAGPPTPQAVDASTLVRYDPFFRHEGEAAPVDLPSLGLVLFAVRTGGPDGGAAIIQAPGEEQRAFTLGEQVAQGFVLQAVAPDHAVLARGRVSARLDFRSDPALAAAETSFARLRIARTIDPAAFLSELALQARVENGEVTGYRLAEGAGGPISARLGLRAGDVLLAVNDRRLTNDARAADLQAEFSGRSEALLRYERDGVEHTSLIRISAP